MSSSHRLASAAPSATGPPPAPGCRLAVGAQAEALPQVPKDSQGAGSQLAVPAWGYPSLVTTRARLCSRRQAARAQAASLQKRLNGCRELVCPRHHPLCMETMALHRATSMATLLPWLQPALLGATPQAAQGWSKVQDPPQASTSSTKRIIGCTSQASASLCATGGCTALAAHTWWQTGAHPRWCRCAMRLLCQVPTTARSAPATAGEAWRRTACLVQCAGRGLSHHWASPTLHRMRTASQHRLRC